MTVFLIFQDLEDLIKAKEKEVEKIEQNGLALIRDKKEEVSEAVVSTLRELKQTWARLDHMVMLTSSCALAPCPAGHVTLMTRCWFF